MRSELNRSESGYSLTELLVVVAIVGVLSLISVPAFINSKNQNTFRADLRNFTNDLRRHGPVRECRELADFRVRTALET